MRFVKLGAFVVDLDLVAHVKDRGGDVFVVFRDANIEPVMLFDADAEAARRWIHSLPESYPDTTSAGAGLS